MELLSGLEPESAPYQGAVLPTERQQRLRVCSPVLTGTCRVLGTREEDRGVLLERATGFEPALQGLEGPSATVASRSLGTRWWGGEDSNLHGRGPTVGLQPSTFPVPSPPRRAPPLQRCAYVLERLTGVEPVPQPWQGSVRPSHRSRSVSLHVVELSKSQDSSAHDRYILSRPLAPFSARAGGW